MESQRKKEQEKEQKESPLSQELKTSPKRFVFDIDGVITEPGGGTDYETARPNQMMIEVINRLYHEGHEIILLTARGYVTGIDWRAVTEEQLARWGVKYHELHFGKPNADYYVDDKMLDMKLLLELPESECKRSSETGNAGKELGKVGERCLRG